MKIKTEEKCKICGGKYYAKGMCSLHYQREKKNVPFNMPLRTSENEYIVKGKDVEVIFYDNKHYPKGKFLISIEDLEKVKKYKWSEMNNGYIYAFFPNHNCLALHRYLTDCPDGLVVDHINHNRKDNRRSNLRICTQKENVANTEWMLGKSGVRGIRRDNGFWRVIIKGKYIGCSRDLEEAKRILEKYYKEKT